MPTVAVNGIDVHYEREGSGPRLLFVSGTGADLRTSRPLVEPFTARFDTVAYDQRGLGRTSIPPGPYTMADYATDALALLDALGWATCRLAGISFGGMVAQEVAVRAPERIERLALLCTSPGGEGGSSYPLHELEALDPEAHDRAWRRLLDVRFDDAWLAAHPHDRAIVEVREAARNAPRTDDQRRGEAEQLGARRGHDVWDRLHRIACATLVAAGAHDELAPVANSAAIAARIPGAELRVYDGGHLFVFQDRRALPEILDFLAA